MSERLTITLLNAQQGHAELMKAWAWAKAMLLAGNRLTLDIRKSTRSTDQNALMWSILTDLSEQVMWPVNGEKQKLEQEEWKDILSAGVRKAQRVAQGAEGGWVLLGGRTSRMTVSEMSDLITLGHVIGNQHGVRWRRTSLGRDAPDSAFERPKAKQQQEETEAA